MGFLSALFGNVVEEVISQGTDMKINSSKVNMDNAYGRLRPIHETSYPAYVSNPQGYLQKAGCLWFMRKDVEAARYYITGGREGYQVSDRVQGSSLTKDDPKAKALLEYMDTAEAKVKDMEEAKGYVFVEVRENNILFQDIKTGIILSADESSSI